MVMGTRPPKVEFVVLLLLAAGTARLAGQQSELAEASRASTQYVLLVNGNVLRGRARRSEDGWTVVDPRGNRLRLTETRVERVFPSMARLLEYRLRQVRSGDLAAQLRVAHWCLRQRYREGALRILQQLPADAADDPRVQALAKQIRMVERSPEAAGGLIEVRSRRSHVAPERVDPALQVEFIQRIEPVLLVNCAQSGCHGAGGAFTYRLIRPFRGQTLRLAQSQFNLQRTLRKIDSHTPDASLLLRFATTPHGGTTRSSTGDVRASARASKPLDDADAALLRRWVLRAAGRPDSLPDASSRASASAAPILAQRSVPQPMPVHRSDPLPARRSDDPYDPEEFNRTRHGSGKVMPGSTGSPGRGHR